MSVKLSKKFVSDCLLLGGVAGLIGTAVLTGRSSIKAYKVLEKDENVDIKDKKEVVKKTWKIYIPAAVMGMSSIGCIIAARNMNVKQVAAFATAYNISASTLKEYKNQIVETLGEEAEKKVSEEVTKGRVQKDLILNPGNSRVVERGPGGDIVCFDTFTGKYFKADRTLIDDARNELNNKMIDDSYASLNDFYDFLGIDSCYLGDEVGWNIACGKVELIYSSQLINNDTPCLAFSYNMLPGYNFDQCPNF